MKEVSPGIFEAESPEEEALLVADPDPQWVVDKFKAAQEASDFPDDPPAE